MKVTNIIKDFDRVLHGKSITIMTTLATVIDTRKEERTYDELGYILGLRYLKKKEKRYGQSSCLTPDTSKARKKGGVTEEEKTLAKKKGLGVKRNNEVAMKDGSSADEGRGRMLGLTDVVGLMKSLKLFIRNMERMMGRISNTSKGDPILEKLKTHNVSEIMNVRRWMDINAEMKKGQQDRRTVATQMAPKERDEIHRGRVSVAVQAEVVQSAKRKEISPWENG